MAKRLLQPIADANKDHTQIWMMLAEACRIAGDDAGLTHAAEHIIATEPRALRAYGWKGDVMVRAGDARAASRWYREGLTQGERFQPLPPGLEEEMTRQRSALETLKADFAKQLDEGLAVRGLTGHGMSPRFAESLELLNGTKNIQLQKPAAYYFPGLPQRAFYEREEFEWVRHVEAASDDIRTELIAVLEDGGLFSPYLQADSTRPHRDFHGMTGNDVWSALHLIENGLVSQDNQARFPKTLAAMELAPLCRIGVRAPTVMFSLLKGGARIAPHHGMINTRLICHLPLIVPGEGALRCGNHVRSWDYGKCLIFDDSIEHEAWNDAKENRIVLIFDIWRPELTNDERAAVAAVFDVIDDDGNS
ncbi:MAG: aspartyl/asparaginyl beta-hydroxylase domain-containing protein [Sphingopyxis sp.]